VAAGGHYDATRQILIDNMFDSERVGYFVITPFALAGGGWILVNRGWVRFGHEPRRTARDRVDRRRAPRARPRRQPAQSRHSNGHQSGNRRHRIPWSPVFRVTPTSRNC
jgi:cytochrome oxidase assembly protein ShyY1